jgi:hypothetical protein
VSRQRQRALVASLWEDDASEERERERKREIYSPPSWSTTSTAPLHRDDRGLIKMH